MIGLALDYLGDVRGSESGGAAALKTLLLDEPLEAMDLSIRKEILAWINSLVSDRFAVVVATHQVEPFIERVERIVLVGNGSCRVDSLPADLTKRAQFIQLLTGTV